MKLVSFFLLASSSSAFYKPNLHLTLVPADVGPTWEKALEHCSERNQTLPYIEDLSDQLFFVEELKAFMKIRAEEAGKPVSELPVSFYIGLKREAAEWKWNYMKEGEDQTTQICNMSESAETFWAPFYPPGESGTDGEKNCVVMAINTKQNSLLPDFYEDDANWVAEKCFGGAGFRGYACVDPLIDDSKLCSPDAGISNSLNFFLILALFYLSTSS
ncbi:Oidioi.mRNA.OKI2018_I69.chr2.g4820.t1.cds [Oikopleura dioica]|uniref:Oidioi.mRNA.OKI2018_I69.chr2.g4820.t1.cds n=1 Tax=Oikopleura dioica TaxID=34765 RepID=A0ABN7T504_OIKDI|nr:Oidioi.mRNA.OKI2018_I69.chr2.g4820.t1.cds [Oikopleura dioica]